MLAQQIANGIVLGAIYGLSALGFTLVFGAARIVNFAYGEILMLGAFLTVSLTSGLGLNFFVAMVLAMLGVALLSVAIFYLTLRPVMRGPSSGLQAELQIILVTLGLLYLLREAAVILWGTSPRQLDLGIPGFVEFGDVLMPNKRLAVVGIMLLLVVALYCCSIARASARRCAPSRRTARARWRSA